MIIIIGTVLLAYLLGSISTAIIVCKLFGILDPRQHGSCNPGATNVLRISGKIPAIITLFGDIIKGMLAIWIARSIKIESIELSCVMLSIFIGHLFPIFFRFQGGKGVATALGIITALSWPLGGLSLITWILVVAATRISSLGAIVTALAAPFYTWWLLDSLSTYTVMLISMLLLIRHKDNIVRMIQNSKTKVNR